VPARRQRLAFAVAGLLLLAACTGFEAPDAEPPAPIEYPVAHYRVTHESADLMAWKTEVRALRATLRDEHPFEKDGPALEGRPREVEFLDRAVDPAALVWRNPAAFWREPVVLSWWELIDETGRIRKVFVVASNQEPEIDSRIIAWCIRDKTWIPATRDGLPSASIRSASINLGESPWHVSHWQKKISEELAMVLVVVAIALVVLAGRAALRRSRSGKAETRSPARSSVRK
jgi:hypothetical protein